MQHRVGSRMMRSRLIGGRIASHWMVGFAAIGVMSGVLGGGVEGAIARPAKALAAGCPAEVEPLVTVMLRDLPAYVNRISTRLGKDTAGTWRYAIVANQPEFTPLPIGSIEYPAPEQPRLQQVFFTVLERQYSEQRVTEFQHYHWLFLAKTEGGWRLALLYSSFGFYPRDSQFLSPPRDVTQGATAQAIRHWLRDCQAGAIRPMPIPQLLP